MVLARGRDSPQQVDQFNSIHERLIALWRDLAPFIPGLHVDFCSMDDPEDWTTAMYLEDTAQQAGLTSSIFAIEVMGWDSVLSCEAGRSAADHSL